MMKKILLNLILVLIFLTIFSACAENDFKEEKKKYKITFIQSGVANIERKVTAGESLKNVPASQAKEGYSVVWDITDFSCINSNLTVNAVESPNTYKIIYNLGERETEAEIAEQEQEVIFDTEFGLYTPTCNGYRFKKWVISGTNTVFTDSIFTTARDVSLTAIWELDLDSDRWWTGFY